MPPQKRGTGSKAQNYFPDASPEVQASIDKLLGSFQSRSNSGDVATMLRHMTAQFSDDPTALQHLIEGVNSQKTPDLSGFDFSTVRVKKESFWVLQLMNMGYEDRNGKVTEEYVDGSQPVFQVIIYDEKSSFRITELVPHPGMPTSEFLLTCIKRAIASPLPPLKPLLPELFIVAYKFKPHEYALRPFLDSLPKPFGWRMETQAEAEEVADGVDSRNKEGVVLGLQQAEGAKAFGNHAMKSNKRADAVKYYGEAIACLHDAWSQKPTETQTKQIKNLMSVCLSNRAAAWLLEGEDQDAKKALKDAEEAIDRDPGYNKAYFRAAKAYQILSETEKAVKILISGLSRKELANDGGLIEALIESLGGIPSTENELRDFCGKVFSNPVTGKDLKKLSGLRLRVNRQIQTIIGPSETIDSI